MTNLPSCRINPDEARNPILTRILLDCWVRIRLGLIPKCQDELGAAVEAIIMDYKPESAKDVKGDKQEMECDWVHLIIHALNFHIMHLTNIAPIAFSNKAEVDSKIRKMHHSLNSALIHIDKGEGKKVQVCVESRDEVRRALINYLTVELGQPDWKIVEQIPERAS